LATWMRDFLVSLSIAFAPSIMNCRINANKKQTP
jgi:hypothetical protein